MRASKVWHRSPENSEQRCICTEGSYNTGMLVMGQRLTRGERHIYPLAWIIILHPESVTEDWKRTISIAFRTYFLLLLLTFVDYHLEIYVLYVSIYQCILCPVCNFHCRPDEMIFAPLIKGWCDGTCRYCSQSRQKSSFKEANQMLAWSSPFKIPQVAVIARKDTIHINENYRWDFMAKSEFLLETILKESANGICCGTDVWK